MSIQESVWRPGVWCRMVFDVRNSSEAIADVGFLSVIYYTVCSIGNLKCWDRVS